MQGSDDEDERGLDRFEEMEGDLDDIDEDKERDKVIISLLRSVIKSLMKTMRGTRFLFDNCCSTFLCSAGENCPKDGLG